MGGKKDFFAASFIAAPCFAVFSLWTWAKWYEIERLDQLMGKEQKEGWFKLLGIKTPPPPFTLQDMLLKFTASESLLMFGMQSPYVLVTHAFSHKDLGHMMSNMIGLYLCSINIPLPSRLGAFKFVSLFVGSAAVGCLAQFAMDRQKFGSVEINSCDGSKDIDRVNDVSLGKSHITPPCLGASGGMSGLLMTAIIWRPKAVVIFPLFPLIDGIPTWTYLAFSLGYDILGLIEQMSRISREPGTQTGHGSHLGGAVVGAAAFLVWRKTFLKF